MRRQHHRRHKHLIILVFSINACCNELLLYGESGNEANLVMRQQSSLHFAPDKPQSKPFCDITTWLCSSTLNDLCPSVKNVMTSFYILYQSLLMAAGRNPSWTGKSILESACGYNWWTIWEWYKCGQYSPAILLGINRKIQKGLMFPWQHANTNKYKVKVKAIEKEWKLTIYIYKELNWLNGGERRGYRRHAIDILHCFRLFLIHLRCVIRKYLAASSQAQWRGIFDCAGFEVVFQWREEVADHRDTPGLP